MTALTRKEKLIYLKVYFLVMSLIAFFGWGFGNFGSNFWLMIGNFLFGWLCMPFRGIGIDLGPRLVWAALGLMLVTGLVHLCWVRLYARIKKPNPPEGTPRPPWRFRWTVAWFGLALLVVLSGLAMAGFLLNSYWIATSPDPIVMYK